MSFQNDIARALGQLDGLDKAIRRSLSPAAQAGAEIVENSAQSKTVSSRIKAGISVRPGDERRDSAEYVVVSTHWLSRIHEYAGKKTPSYRSRRRPFWRPAIDSTQNEVARAIERTINNSARRATR